MTSSDPASLKWQTGPIGQFYECGESAAIYFDPASGDTHLVSEFAAYLIRRLAGAAQPLDLAEIIALVRDDIEAEHLPELSLALPEILKTLTDLDIVTAA